MRFIRDQIAPCDRTTTFWGTSGERQLSDRCDFCDRQIAPERFSGVDITHPHVIHLPPRACSVIFSLIQIPFGRIQLYQKPISMRFGERKLTQLCRQELGREPKINELFLFYNTKRNTLKLFWLDDTGSQEIIKVVPRGGFILPAPKDGETFVTLPRSKLESVFRTGRSRGRSPQ
jgi:hypothetical protein